MNSSFIRMIIRIRQTSRWETFSFLRLVRLEPRSLFTYTFLLALLVQFAHDVLLYSIKINEGYDTEPMIVEKPELKWSPKDLRLNNISTYLDSIWMSFTISSLFTLQIFWSHIMEQMSRRQYTGAWEYWICLILAILLLPIFPILVYLLDALFANPKYKENIPQLLAGGIALILCIIGGLRVHFGIGRLLKLNSRPILQNMEKLKYFQDLNLWLSFALFIWSTSYIIISVDGILPIINMTRFISDLLITHANFGGFIFYICMISIFNPDFSITQKQRAISTPFDVTKTDSSINISEILGPDIIDAQIKVETSQDVKIEHAYINPSYRPYSITPPVTPNSTKNVLLTPMPSPSSTFAVNLNRNQHRLSPLHQSWQQGQSISDVSSQQTLDNDQAILTEHVDRYDDESTQHDTLNGSLENYNNIYHNNPIKRIPSQNNNRNISPKDSMYDRSNSV
ncbi:hypothetical protein C1645_750043 [Glomus cerebriforme]|uniref:Uncharacterized protein n=1 Tax=Glomus cerebriforme TaxID=658196 RepID=A0A397TJF5_9GLOM|nr:hypothetical protein C1645_750043 [Glomus cerebriforme]